MTIEKLLNDDTLTLKVSGRLDTTTAPELEAAVNESHEGADKLVMDLGDLEYISSAGLRVLLATQKIMAKKGGMKVVGVNEVVMEVFEITGFADILDIEQKA